MKTQTVGNSNSTSFDARDGGGLSSPSEQRIDAGRALHLGHRAGDLTVIAGRVWLTRSGDLGDHVLVAGERLRLGANENAVLEPWDAGHVVTVRWNPGHASFGAAVVAEPLQVLAFLTRRFLAACVALTRGTAATRRGTPAAAERCVKPVASQGR